MRLGLILVHRSSDIAHAPYFSASRWLAPLLADSSLVLRAPRLGRPLVCARTPLFRYVSSLERSSSRYGLTCVS